MRKDLRNILDGIARVLILDPAPKYKAPSKSDFRKDAENLRNDVTVVAKDMRSAIHKYGKINNCES